MEEYLASRGEPEVGLEERFMRGFMRGLGTVGSVLGGWAEENLF